MNYGHPGVKLLLDGQLEAMARRAFVAAGRSYSDNSTTCLDYCGILYMQLLLKSLQKLHLEQV